MHLVAYVGLFKLVHFFYQPPRFYETFNISRDLGEHCYRIFRNETNPVSMMQMSSADPYNYTCKLWKVS